MTAFGYAGIAIAIVGALVAVSQIKTSALVYDTAQFKDNPRYIPGHGLLVTAGDRLAITGDPAEWLVGGQKLLAKPRHQTVGELTIEWLSETRFKLASRLHG